jgi:hypothetical protein
MRKSEAGQALIMVTLSLTFLFGMMGLAVDLGWSYYRRQAAQTAAEAAASAAAVATMSNGTITCTNAVCQAATACPANPTTPPATNIASGCLYAKANGFLNSGKQSVQIAANLTAPPAVSGVSTLYWVTATVTEQNAQLFSRFLGGHTFGGVAAQATAGVFQGAISNCVYVLDPHASQAFMDSGSNSNLQTSCGVYVNSNSATAVVVNGQGHVNAPVIDVVGNYSACNNGVDCFYNPSLPLTNQSAVADPFASLAAPTYSGCSGSTANLNLNQGTPAPLNPGVYCGGITVSGNAQVTLNPGVYILNGGGLNVNSANASITGSGVTFYNTANGYTYGPIVITGQSTVHLSAPASGTYGGILFYQDRAITSSSNNQIDGTSNPNLVGSIYFPTTPLLITGGSANTPFIGKVVARTLTINGGGVFISLSGPATGTGSGSKYAALIQ